MKPATVLLCLCVGSLVGLPARAANPAFQEFFFRVCESPTGALAARCGETPAGAGDLSGDSESSLNPSQTLSSTDGALAAVRARTREARERVERYRDGGRASEVEVPFGPFSLLLNGRLAWEDRDRDADLDTERGFEADRRAIEVGIDRRFSDRFVAGLVYSFEDSDLDFDAERPGVNFTPAEDAGGIEQESHAFTLFGLFWLSERAYLEVNGGYATSDYTVRRNSVFQESTRSITQTNVRTRASTDGEQLWLGATAGFDWNVGANAFGVYAGGTFADSRVDGYRERDLAETGLALSVDDVDRDAFTAHVGLRAQRAIAAGSGVWIPQLRVEYEHAGGVDESEATVQFALDGAGNRFALRGDDTDDDYFNIAVGIAGVFPRGWMAFADVETLVGARDRDQVRFTAGLRKEL